jgi:hypothetical protein
LLQENESIIVYMLMGLLADDKNIRLEMMYDVGSQEPLTQLVSHVQF